MLHIPVTLHQVTLWATPKLGPWLSSMTPDTKGFEALVIISKIKPYYLQQLALSSVLVALVLMSSIHSCKVD